MLSGSLRLPVNHSGKELKAIDAEWAPRIARAELAAAADALKRAADKLQALGKMDTTSTPGTDLIGVVTTAIATLAAAGMQPAPSTALTSVAAEVATPSTALGV